MERVGFFLVCLACACSANVSSRPKSQDRELDTDEVFSVKRKNALSRILLAFNPAVSFASGTRLCPNGVGKDLSPCYGIHPGLSARHVRFGPHTMSMSRDTDNDEDFSGKSSSTEDDETSSDSIDIASDLSAATYAGSAVCAGFELLEDTHALKLHGGHGMLWLASSKLCREMGELLATTSVLEREASNKLHWASNKIVKAFAFLFRLITSKTASLVLALGALAASLNEVREDLMPGGHHGVALLAISDALELLDTSHLLEGRLKKWLDSGVLKLALAIGAAVGATLETLGSLHLRKLGTHHGVLLLAVSKILKYFGQLRLSVNEGKEGLKVAERKLKAES